MKEKFLQAQDKNTLRVIAKKLGTPKVDRLPKEKLIAILSTHPYKSLVQAIQPF